MLLTNNTSKDDILNKIADIRYITVAYRVQKICGPFL